MHFACHGVTDTQDPRSSGLLLQKTDESGITLLDQLTMRSISSNNVKGINAKIAYPSACSTAVNAVDLLQDECIHIASAFQLAGFSHVLATLWMAQDDAARVVVVEFYRRLFSNPDNEVVEHAKVSYSFHQVVKSLREKKRYQPILWASFIYTGA